MSSAAEIAIKTAFSLVILIGTLGNVLVCLVILLYKSMRTPMNHLLVNLAISDMMLLLFFSPTFVFRDAFTHPTGKDGDLLCIFITGETFAWMGGYASAVFLLAIAIERYYAVANPHSYGSSFVTKHLKLLVAGCWIFAFAWNASGFATKHYNEEFGFCDMKWETKYSFKAYAALSFLTVGIIPSIAMIVLYSRVVYALWFKRQTNQISHDQERDRLRRKKATKMVLSVSVIYTVCWIPELTIFVLAAFAPHLVKGNVAYPVSVAMVSFNSAVNPLIYSFHNNRIRHRLKGLLCCNGNRERRVANLVSGMTGQKSDGTKPPDDTAGAGNTPTEGNGQ